MKKGYKLSPWIMICKALTRHSLRILDRPEKAYDSEVKCRQEISEQLTRLKHEP